MVFYTAPVAPQHIPFSSLHDQAGLISLDAARQDPTIVYRSFDIMYPEDQPIFRPPTPAFYTAEFMAPAPTVCRAPPPVIKSAIRLIPLAVAQARREIKYRREGFEMNETRRHILTVRAD